MTTSVSLAQNNNAYNNQAKPSDGAKFASFLATRKEEKAQATKVTPSNVAIDKHRTQGPDIDKIVDDTVSFYANTYQELINKDDVRKFTKECLEKFSKTDAYKNNPETQEKSLKALAELCASYKSGRNPGYKDIEKLKRASSISDDKLGLRTDMASVINAICDGKIDFKNGRAPLTTAHGCREPIVTTAENNNATTPQNQPEPVATALPDFKNPGHGSIYLGSTIPGDPSETEDVSTILHEGKHIEFYNKYKTIDCNSALVTEYDSYKTQFTYESGNNGASGVASRLGNFLIQGVEAKTGNYHILYENLQEPQKNEFTKIVGELKRGKLITTDEFENRIRNAK